MALGSVKAQIPVLLRKFSRRPGLKSADEILSKPSKVLLIKQSERLGNIVLLNGAISGLAARFPGVEIELLLPASYRDVMALNSNVAEIIPVFKRHYIYMPWKLVKLIGTLRARRYDLAIDCSDVNSHSSTGAVYAILSGAKITAGWRISESRLFDIEVERFTDTVHASEMYNRLFSGIFSKEIRGEPYFDNRVKLIPSSGTVIGINCGGRGTKRWPLKNFVKLGGLLAQNGKKVEFILGPEESNLRDELKANLPENSTLLPLMSLPKLMAQILDYDLFISSDTGPMHLAWNLRIPTIAIFTNSELEKFRPLSPGSLALDGKENLAPERVAEMALKILNSRKINA